MRIIDTGPIFSRVGPKAGWTDEDELQA